MDKQLSLGFKISKIEPGPTVKYRIAAGAKFLDERRGVEWRELVDVVELDIKSPEKCVLGQLFEHFKVGCDELGIRPFKAARLGFNVMDPGSPSADREFRALKNGWCRELRPPRRLVKQLTATV